MPRTLRCKFYVDSVEEDTSGQEVVELSAVYDGPLSEEDRAFSDSTPWGNAKFGINNPTAKGVLKPGMHVYLDITPAEP